MMCYNLFIIHCTRTTADAQGELQQKAPLERLCGKHDTKVSCFWKCRCKRIRVIIISVIIKGIFQPEIKILSSFAQTHLIPNTLFLLWNTSGDVQLSVHAALFHI